MLGNFRSYQSEGSNDRKSRFRVLTCQQLPSPALCLPRATDSANTAALCPISDAGVASRHRTPAVGSRMIKWYWNTKPSPATNIDIISYPALPEQRVRLCAPGWSLTVVLPLGLAYVVRFHRTMKSKARSTVVQERGRGRLRLGNVRIECIIPSQVYARLIREEDSSGIYRTRLCAHIICCCAGTMAPDDRRNKGMLNSI